MKKQILSIVFFVLVAFSIAQITITETDIPNFGTSFLIGKDTVLTQPAYDYFQTGTSFNWNPSAVNEDETGYYHFKDPSASPYYINFLDANLMINITGQGDLFLKKSNTEILLLGMVDSSRLAFPIVAKLNKPDTFMLFPMTYLTSFSSETDANGTIYEGSMFDSISAKIEISTSSLVDGWGTLIHPSASIDVLREVQNKITTDSVWGIMNPPFYMRTLISSNTDTTLIINYHANNFGLPIFSIEANADSVISEIKWIKDVSNNIRGNYFKEIPIFTVFPNPINDIFNVSIINGEAEKFEIFDMNGKLINFSNFKDNKEVIVDGDNWVTGIYIIRLFNDNMVVGEAKIIKQ